MTTMEKFLCWAAGSVRQTVYSDIGALPSDADALFLAAHTPMALSHRLGETVDGEGSGEHDVLTALLSDLEDPDRNTLIAVTGGSGTGKSHVVRWVNAHLPANPARYHVLYVPRAIQTIRELLRRIVDGLPGGGGSEFMERIDTAVATTSPTELRDRLLEEMRFALTWTMEPKPARHGESEDQQEAREDRNNLLGERDEGGKRRSGLADLLALTPINSLLLRTGGTLDAVVESIIGATSRRDAQRFELDDLPLKTSGVLTALRSQHDLQDLWSIVRGDPESALDVLNEALQHATVKALGLRAGHGETLDMLFRQARQMLHREGKQLILLFEDLAQFGLIDGELYDQFATQPGDDLAPLRTVFAVTNGPFDNIVDTVRTRITHRFVVDGALADREAFVARYLNLVRLGRDEVESAWTRARESGDTEWVKNACDEGFDGEPCPLRARCHEAFGTVSVPGLGEVGLYPYNEIALRRTLNRRLEIPPHTPRTDLNGCFTEGLAEAHIHIPRGTYPLATTFTRLEHTVKLPKEVVLAGDSGEEADRRYRAMVLWGDEQILPATVTEAFGIDVAKSAVKRAEPASARKTEPATAQKPARTTQPALSSTPSKLPPLYQWQNGVSLPDGELKYYRTLLHKLVSSRLQLDEYFVDDRSGSSTTTLLNKMFRSSSFGFGDDAYGRAIAAGGVRFELGRNSEDVKVLMAARWFDDHLHWNPEEGKWPWPDGYDPADLALALEHRLQQWSDVVRNEFFNRFNVREAARAAVCVRAIALVGAGTQPAQVRTLDQALAPFTANHTSSAWSEVSSATLGLLTQSLVIEAVGDFASVRQGTGAPQLVDTEFLEAHLSTALRSPVDYLQRVIEDFAEVSPALVVHVKSLLSAITKAAPDMLSQTSVAVASLAKDLAGARPSAVVKAARTIAQRAIESGFFRPEGSRPEFDTALEMLGAMSPAVSVNWRQDADSVPGDEAIRVQSWAYEAIQGARALTTIRQIIAATQAECHRNAPESGDLDKLEHQIYEKLAEVRRGTEALSTSRGSDD